MELSFQSNNQNFKQLQNNLKELFLLQITHGIHKEEEMRIDGESNITIAKKNNEGTRRIPKRDFLNYPVKHELGKIQKEINRSIQKYLLHKNGPYTIWNNISIEVSNATQNAFDTKGFGMWAPNALSTIIAKKGKDSPLIWTSQLRKSVKAKVKKIV